MNNVRVWIDASLCNGDGLCAAVCPARVFDQSAPGALPSVARPQVCIDCGHCVAICPTDAMRHADMDPARCTPVDAQPAVPPEQLLHLLRKRRSVRHFRPKPVPRQALELLLEAGRCAPTASNAQEFEFIVIQDAQRIRHLAHLACGPFALMLKLLRNPITRAISRLVAGARTVEEGLENIEEMQRIAAAPKTGEDPIFLNAPAVILTHAPAGSFFAETDCANAQHQMALMADAMGLGATTIGYFIVSARYSPALKRALRLPRGHRLYGALIVGYPRYRWRRLPERRPARVRWEKGPAGN